MAKTTFGPGVIVTSKWLNGAKSIKFDGQDVDWHYPQLNIEDIQRGGAQGLNAAYVTIDTDQTFIGVPVTGAKSFLAKIEFGDKLLGVGVSAPKSWHTIAKFDSGSTFSQRMGNLEDEDIITKKVLTEQIDNFPIVDEGFF